MTPKPASRKRTRFKVGQIVFDANTLSYGLLARREAKGLYTIVCTRGILGRREYVAAEEDLRPLTKRERGE